LNKKNSRKPESLARIGMALVVWAGLEKLNLPRQWSEQRNHAEPV